MGFAVFLFLIFKSKNVALEIKLGVVWEKIERNKRVWSAIMVIAFT